MPDAKVIGKISNTLEEIRDILIGRKSSVLYNSIQSIASTNVSINELMKELVDTTKTNNKVTLLKDAALNRHGNNSNLMKSTNKYIKNIQNTLHDIFDEVKLISKKSNFTLKNANDKKVLDKIINDTTKDNKGKKLIDMINVVSKLKNIRIKDLFTSKAKVNHIEKIYDRLIEIYSKIKSNDKIKDTDDLNTFALGAVDVIKKISKIGFLSKLASIGVKTIDKVFLGKNGIINTLVEIKKHESDVKKAKRISNDLLIISGRVFLVSLIMSGVALLGIPALVGTVMAAGIIGLFGLTVSAIGLLDKPIRKGNSVLGPMMTSLILAGAGLWLINKGTKDMQWNQLAMAGAAILGFGTIAALLGIPVVFGLVSLGAVALTLLGTSLVLLGGGIALFGLMVNDDAIDKVSNGIPKIFKAMTSIFGDEEGGNVNFGNTIVGLITGCLKLGGAIFASGALIIMGISLGFLGIALRSWENFNIKSIDNVTYAISQLDNVLGLGIKNNRNSEGGLIGQGVGIISDTFGLASTLLQSGKVFATMGTLLFSGIVLGLIKDSIDKWKNFDTKSLDNIDTAITKMDDIFNLGIKNKSTNPLINAGLNVINTVGGIFGLGVSLLNFGSSMFKLGTLSIAIGVVDKIVSSMEKWKKFNDSSLDNVLNAVTKFGNFFGIEFDGKKKTIEESVSNSVVHLIGDSFNLLTSPIQIGATLLQGGKNFIKLGTLSMAIGIVDKMIDSLIKAGKHASEMESAQKPIFDAFDKMINYFFNDDRLDTSMWDVFSGLGSAAIGGLLFGPIGAIGGALLAKDEKKTKLSILTTSVSIVDKMVNVLIKMGKYSGDVNSSLNTTFDALNKLTDYLFDSPDKNGAGALSKITSAMSKYRTDSLMGGHIFDYMFGDGSSQINTQLEVLTSCVAIIGTMADALTKMNKLSSDLNTPINNVFKVLDKITEYFFDDPDKNASGALSKIGSTMAKAHSNGNMLEFLFGDGSKQINTRLEIITGCVGIVGKVAEILSSMKDTKEMNDSINNLTTSIDSIINYFTDKTEGEFKDIEDIADELPDIVGHLVKVSDKFKDASGSISSIQQFNEIAMPSIDGILSKLAKYNNGEYDLDNIENISEKLPTIFKNVWMVMTYMEGDYRTAFTNFKELCSSLTSVNSGNVEGLYNIGTAFNAIANGLVYYSNYTDVSKVNKLNSLIDKSNDLAKIGNTVMFNSITKVIDKVNEIDIEKAQALTDTFKSFTGINTFGGFFFNFKKQVGLFTDACVRLVEAINGNTDALTTENIMDESENATPEPSKKSIVIGNVQELADLIADAISGNSFGGGLGESIPVELRINGEGGDSWVIRKY